MGLVYSPTKIHKIHVGEYTVPVPWIRNGEVIVLQGT